MFQKLLKKGCYTHKQALLTMRGIKNYKAPKFGKISHMIKSQIFGL